MRGVRPLEAIISDKGSGWLMRQKRLSIPRWSAGPKRDEVTRIMVGSFHVKLQMKEKDRASHLPLRSTEAFAASPPGSAENNVEQEDVVKKGRGKKKVWRHDVCSSAGRAGRARVAVLQTLHGLLFHQTVFCRLFVREL